MNEYPIDFHVLFVLHKPLNQDSLIWKDFWINFRSGELWPGLSNELHNTLERKLAENIWLIPLKDGLPFLGRLVASAKMVGLPYKMLYFDRQPKWLVSEHESKLHELDEIQSPSK